MRNVSAYKKLITFFTLAVVALIATATTTEAQGFRRRVVVVGGFYRPYYPFYASPYWFGDPWYGGYQYPPYGYYGWEPEASVRVEVTPRDAEVYVDGYYAGTVDDFDGSFQRLRVEPGEHEIAIFREGFRTFRQKVYLARDNTFRIRQALAPLAPGDQPEAKPQPMNPPPGVQGGQAPTQTPRGMPRRPAGRRGPPPDQQGPEPRSGQPGSTSSSAYGTLTIKSQPADAEVSIDGENWRGPAGQDRLVIELAEGSHTVEIRKPGYRTYVTQVEIRRGEATPLNVSLRGEQQ
jgi:hypothetical protein